MRMRGQGLLWAIRSKISIPNCIDNPYKAEGHCLLKIYPGS